MNACPVAASRTARLEPWMAAPEGDPDALPPDAAAAELISQSRFNLPLSRLSQPADGAGAGGSGGNGGLRIWVRGAGGGFGGRPTADFRREGTVLGGYLGIDAGVRQDALVGLAMAHSRSEVDYTLESVTSGTANLTLTSMLPYAHWRPRAGLEVWGLAGVGLGDAALQDKAGKESRAEQMWDSKEEVFRGPGRSGRGAEPAGAGDRLGSGHGVATHGGAGLVTPYAGLSLAGSELNDYRLGARLNAGSGMNLGLEGRGGWLREYEVMLYGRLDW